MLQMMAKNVADRVSGLQHNCLLLFYKACTFAAGMKIILSCSKPTEIYCS